MTRAAIFAALRPYAPAGGIPVPDVPVIDALADRWGWPQDAQPARRIGTRGLALIKRFEGLRLKAYKCPADVWTIGYGSTGPHVDAGKVITEQEAEVLLLDDLERFEAAVVKLTPVTTDGQFDALTSFAFNLGEEALRTSTLRRLHNEGDYAAAADQFARWNKANGKVLPGLVTRRAAEAALYRGEA